MSAPLESAGFKTLYVGNPKDDDGTVIDSFLKETDTPPAAITESIRSAPLEHPKRVTRIFSGTALFKATEVAAGTVQPQQILPADTNRQDLTLKVYGASTATDFIYIADENGKMSTSAAGKLRPSSADFDLSSHTGAVWAYPGAAITSDMELYWWATTL